MAMFNTIRRVSFGDTKWRMEGASLIISCKILENSDLTCRLIFLHSSLFDSLHLLLLQFSTNACFVLCASESSNRRLDDVIRIRWN